MKLQRLLGALCAGLVLISLPVGAAEQGSYVTPTSGPMPFGTFVGTYLNPALRSLASCSWGSSAPVNGPSGAALPYQCWADTTTNPVVFKFYDGASWVVAGKLNTSTHTWTPSRQGTDLGTASIATTGTSGHAVPFLDGANTFSGVTTFSSPTASTSPSNGGAVVTGGLGVGGSARILGAVISGPNSGTASEVGQFVANGGTAAAGGGSYSVGKNGSADWIWGHKSAVLSSGTSSNFLLFMNGVGSAIEVDSSTRAVTLGTPLPAASGGTGLSSLGSGIPSWLATPSSANLLASMTDETGTGSLVFANSPTLVTPTLGAATATSLATTGQTAGAFATNWSGIFTVNQNATTLVGVTNSTSGASASAGFRLVGGTANSFTSYTVDDLSGSPRVQLNAGTGVVNGFQFTGQGVQFGAPTGGNKGVGTINLASGLYNNGALMTLPSVADTLVGRATTDTLTNKTLTTPIISSISNTGLVTLPTATDTLVGRATADTLTNKVFNCANNTCTVRLGSDVTGTLPKANGGIGATTLSSALDTEFSSTQGSVLYRNASGWVALAPGGSGQLLASGGTAANPSWITASGTGTVTSVICGTGLTGGTITASGTCANDYATKSDQQTGTATAKTVNSARQQDHDSALKAWVNISGSTGAILSSYGVSGVSKVGTGNYTITFSTAFASATAYGCISTPFGLGISYFNGTQAAGSISVQTITAASAAIDLSSLFVTCQGRQ